MRVNALLGICLLLSLSACTQIAELIDQTQQQEEKVSEQQQQANALAEQFRNVVEQKAVSARILVNAHPYEQLFYMPAKEFARLKSILSHTEAVPVAEGGNVVVFVSYPHFETLILMDAQGREYDLPVMERLWMRKSEAEALPATRARRSDEPYWCLPDAEFAAMEALPTLKRARAWAKLHARGVKLSIPNNPAPPPAPAEEEPSSEAGEETPAPSAAS